MFAGEARLDHIDVRLHRSIERWVALTWRDGLFPPPKGVPFGTHVASFIHCLPGQEIRGLNICWLVESPAGVFRRSCEPFQGIEATWFFKYDTLKKFQFQELTDLAVDALRFPDFDSAIKSLVEPNLREFRRMEHVHPFRHPGYPDDVAASYGREDDQFGSEQVWVRVQRTDSANSFSGVLLNQPGCHAGNKGDHVIVRYIGTDTASILVCGPPTRKT
jgi:hypothetical protein